MKKVLIAVGMVSLSIVSASAQSKGTTVSGQPGELSRIVVQPGGHARILGSSTRVNQNSTEVRPRPATPVTADLKENHSNSSQNSAPPVRLGEQAHATRPLAADARARTSNVATSPASSPVLSTTLSQIYRIGAGDVLDVQLADIPTTKSTLFTVQASGLLEYPLAGDPLPVAGLTADEIATRLRSSIKVFENPRVIVRVRDYSSHSVMITGLVATPGAKFLRREAIPFYVVLAESQPQAEATNATILRAGEIAFKIDLKDQRSLATLVQPGDEIKVFGVPPAPASYFYISGAISSPGQKSFHAGLTLTQAIIASGGLTHSAAGKVKILRQGSDGKLTTTELNLRQIEAGKIVDPVLLSGDRIAAL